MIKTKKIITALIAAATVCTMQPYIGTTVYAAQQMNTGLTAGMETFREEKYVYEVKGDSYDTEKGATYTLQGLGILPESISYVIDLTKTANDYNPAESAVDEEYEKTTTLTWEEETENKIVRHKYDCKVKCRPVWSDERITAGSSLFKHGKAYTFSYVYTWPEDDEFKEALKHVKDSELNKLIDAPRFKLVLEKKEKKSAKKVTVKDKNAVMDYILTGKGAVLTRAEGKKVAIPASITVNGKKYKITGLDKNTFSYNKKLEEVTINNVIEELPDSVFDNAEKLKKVTLGKKMRTIKTRLFRKCKKLDTLAVRSEVQIESNAFKKCRTLTLKYKNMSKDRAKEIAKQMVRIGKAKRVYISKG